jgi:hypothetical protein
MQGWGRRRRNRGGEGRQRGDILIFTDKIIDNSTGEEDTSLYGDLGLNPFVIQSVKLPAKSSTSSHCFFFSKFYIFCLEFRWYIPTGLPIDLHPLVNITGNY